MISNIYIMLDFYLDNYNYNFEIVEHRLKEFNYINYNELLPEQKLEIFRTKKFAILRRLECPNCGFFSFYIVNLGCVFHYLSIGFIPIVDLQSYNNVYNNGNTSLKNPWEIFFNQSFNYSLEEIKKYAKNIQYFECKAKYRPSEINIYYENKSINLNNI